MTLEELIIKIRAEGLERAKEGIKGISDEAKKAEGDVGGLAQSFDTFAGIPGPIGEAASRLGDLGNTVKTTYAAMQSATTAFTGASATTATLGGATVTTAGALGAATAPTVAQAGAVGKLAVANAAAAASQEELQKSYQSYRNLDNLVTRHLVSMRKQLGDTTAEARAYARTVTRELQQAFAAAGGPTSKAALDQMTQLNATAENGVGSFTRFGKAMAEAMKSPAGIAASVVAIAGAIGIFQGLSFAGPLDDLGDMGEKMGLSATQVMVLKQEMEAAGTSIDTYAGGLQKVANALTKSDEESKKAVESLKTLGVEYDKNTTAQDLLAKISADYATKLKEGNVSASEMSALQVVLGKNYREVIVAVQAKSKADERANQLAAIGIGLSVDGAKAASDYEEATNNLAAITSVMGSQLVADVVPAFTSLKNAMAESYKNGGLVRVAFDLIKGAANLLMVPLRFLFNAFIDIDMVVTGLGKTIGAVFAAIATRSSGPLKDLKNDLVELKAKRDALILPIWGQGSNEILKNQEGLNANAPDKPAGGKDPVEKAKDYSRIQERLANIFEDLQLKAMALVGVDTERIKLQEKIRDILKELPGLTEEQKQTIEQAALIQYNANKAREQALSIEKMITEEIAKQYQTTMDLRQRAAESVIQAQNELRYTLMSNKERDAAKRRDDAVRPFDARIKQDQKTIDRIEGTEGPMTQQDIASLAAARVNIARLKTEREEALASVNAYIDAADKASQSLDTGLVMGINRAMDQLPTMAEGVASLITKTSSALQDTLVNTFISGKFQVRDFFKMLLTELLKLITQLFIVQPLLQMFKSAFGGATGGSGATVAPAAAAANGLAFDSGKVIPFAKGGIFDGPTMFGLAGGNLGVAGEAGPEAAVPLIRGPNGKLGVQNFGKKSSDAVIVNNNISVNIGSVDSQERKDEMLREMKTLIRQESNASIYEAMRRGGALSPV